MSKFPFNVMSLSHQEPFPSQFQGWELPVPIQAQSRGFGQAWRVCGCVLQQAQPTGLLWPKTVLSISHQGH